ncbi:gp391 [Bacillus phage G]|uniref:Gp391 n=1 Tax=Bacillus phage G TaxID=2884420 RepID=G3MAD2_9CAUD|nr:gp391 [Bacillus phage G]AEO93650.1 gp391 [Bacillus phage G]
MKNEEYYNLNFYKRGTVETKEFIFKDEIIEYIIEKIRIQGDSSYIPGYKSNSYYIPDDPGEVYLNCEGNLKLSIIEEKYGKFNDEDIEFLKDDLNENENFEEFLKAVLRDFKAHQISDFSIERKEIVVNKDSIYFLVEAGNFEINRDIEH